MAIPEFVLRKLIVPGSLRSNDSGFEFALLNTFASATISHFSLSVAGKEIPLAAIRLYPSNGNDLMAEVVNQDNPMLLPVGVQIVVKVTGFTLSGPVQISVDTREIGNLQFSIADSSKNNQSKKLAPIWRSYFKKPLQAKVEIDTLHPRGEASPFLLGQFIEHLERCIYDGIWTRDGSSLRQDTLELMKKMKIPMLRYPGGNFASGYHWEDGIGPKEKRPIRKDDAWLAQEINQVGTDEFLSLCEELDIEPYLCVNDGSGTAEEAARWVAYCNSPEDTEQGRKRAENGHAQPYNVKYWGVGNEVWGKWQIGTTSAKDYVLRMKQFVHAMKAVDPTIKIIVVGNNPLTDDPNDPDSLWNKEVLAAADEFDHISWHIYQPEQDSWKESYDPQSLFASVCAAPLDFAAIIDRVYHQIQESAGKGRVTQCIDEWNLWLPPLPGAKSMHQVTYTMRDCLYVAGIISALYKNYDKVDIANLAQLVNVLPLIKTNETQAIATSIYYPFVLAAELCENVLPVKVDSSTFNSEIIGKNVQSHQNVPYLDAIATADAESEECTLLLLNRSSEKRIKVELDLNGEDRFSKIEIKEIKAASPEAFNSFEHPDQVHIHDRGIRNIKDSAQIVTLVPASVMLVKLIK